jgi:hypothetical protein
MCENKQHFKNTDSFFQTLCLDESMTSALLLSPIINRACLWVFRRALFVIILAWQFWGYPGDIHANGYCFATSLKWILLCNQFEHLINNFF